MKPIQILFFLAGVLGILALVMTFFPKEGVSVTDSFSLRFLSWEEVLGDNEVQYADITGIEKIAAVDVEELAKDTVLPDLTNDTIKNLTDTIRYSADSLKAVLFKIQFPQNDQSILYPFFKSINESGQLIRILHYGDSQLEGDRISSFIRHRLHRNLGGHGAGLLPAKAVIENTMSVSQSASDNWSRHVIFGKRDSTIDHEKYGAMIGFSRFSPPTPDSLPLSDTTMKEAWFTIEKSRIAYSTVYPFQQFRMFYRNNRFPVEAELYSGDTLLSGTILNATSEMRVWRELVDNPVETITVKLKGKDSPDILAVGLDGLGGIAVDNIPLRGSSGLEFTQSDMNFLSQMYRKLNVGMIIMQFGVNVVPNVVEDYTFYRRWFYSQLAALRRHNPNIPIIVIGVSDMSRKNGLYYESYPNIEKIRDAQKAAAFQAGCGFWDMYEAMGGQNSMPSWVFADPPLAGKDFTHFNYTGAKVIAEMFFNAFWQEYTDYIHRNDRSYQPRYKREKVKHY